MLQLRLPFAEVMLNRTNILHTHCDRVHLLVPLTILDPFHKLQLLPLSLRIHTALDLAILRPVNDIVQRSMSSPQPSAIDCDVAFAVLRRNLPEDDHVDGEGIVEREDMRV